jgi:hypothetical protein
MDDADYQLFPAAIPMPADDGAFGFGVAIFNDGHRHFAPTRGAAMALRAL